MANRKTWRCVDCGEIHEKVLGETFLVGYAEIGPRRRKVCYKCCGLRDRGYMRRHGRMILYLASTAKPHPSGGQYWEVGNWPGTLVFPCGLPRKGRHNFAGVRYDVWFRGPGSAKDGFPYVTWHGVQYGDWTQIVHCRRLRA